MKQTRAEIVSTAEVVTGIRLFWLKAPEIAESARPGQFVMIHCGEDTLLRRPISLHRVDGDSLALLVAEVGKGTHWLTERKKGERIDIFGPLGNGFMMHPETDNLLLVAGGIGIAPLVFLADTALAGGRKVTFITGARSADCLLPVSALQKLYDRGMMAASINVINATEELVDLQGSRRQPHLVVVFSTGSSEGASSPWRDSRLSRQRPRFCAAWQAASGAYWWATMRDLQHCWFGCYRCATWTSWPG